MFDIEIVERAKATEEAGLSRSSIVVIKTHYSRPRVPRHPRGPLFNSTFLLGWPICMITFFFIMFPGGESSQFSICLSILSFE